MDRRCCMGKMLEGDGRKNDGRREGNMCEYEMMKW